MASSPTPNWLKVALVKEQKGKCPLTGRKVGTSSGNTHHWCYKRLGPAEVIHSMENAVVLDPAYHMTEGQTKEVTRKLLAYKLSLGYDIFGWVEKLIESGTMKTRPDIYGFTEEDNGWLHSEVPRE